MEVNCTEKKKSKCNLCNKLFSRKDSLKRHMNSAHRVALKNDFKHSCHLCDHSFFFKWKLTEHLASVHECNILKENLNFATEQEFFDWKEKIEEVSCVYFSKQYASYTSKNFISHNFLCQNDGHGKAHRKVGDELPKTSRRNKKGKIKTGGTCPAKMRCRKSLIDGSCDVEYIKSHNHSISSKDIQHHPIPKSLRNEILTKISLGIPEKTIAKDLRVGHGSRDNRDSDLDVQKKLTPKFGK